MADPLPAPTWEPAADARGAVDAHVALWPALALTAVAHREPDGTWTAAAWRRVGRRTHRRRAAGYATPERAQVEAYALARELAAVRRG